MSRKVYTAREYSLDGAGSLNVHVSRLGDDKLARFNWSSTCQTLSVNLNRTETEALARMLSEVLEDWSV